MRQINLRFGTIYVEEPHDREEEGRIKIFDSDKKHLDYVSEDSLNYEELIKSLENSSNPMSLLEIIGVSYEFITSDWKDVWWYLYKPNCPVEKTVDSIANNEFVNRIGTNYIVITEC